MNPDLVCAVFFIAAATLIATVVWMVKRIRTWSTLTTWGRVRVIGAGVLVVTFICLESIPVHVDKGRDGFCDYIGIIPIMGVCGIS